MLAYQYPKPQDISSLPSHYHRSQHINTSTTIPALLDKHELRPLPQSYQIPFFDQQSALYPTQRTTTTTTTHQQSPTPNPPIRIQRSTPTTTTTTTPSSTSENPQAVNSAQPSMQHQNNWSGGNWDNDSGVGLLSPINFQPYNQLAHAGGHKRHSSGSTIHSSSPSPHPLQSSYPQLTGSESAFHETSAFNADQYVANWSKPLPTPVHTPVQSSFLSQAFPQAYYSMSQHDRTAAEMAVKQEGMDHIAGEEEPSGYPHSTNSASTMSHNSPATPRSNNGDFEDRKPLPATASGEARSVDVDFWIDTSLLDPTSDFQPKVPGLDRTMSDIYGDELHNPYSSQSQAQPTSTPKQAQSQGMMSNAMLSPYHRSVFNERLQAANSEHQRSQSPAVSLTRQRSPFREGSKYAPAASSLGQTMAQPRLGSAAAQRQQQKAMDDVAAYAAAQQRQEVMEAPKTISPKDAVLDYHESAEDADMGPLFPSNPSYNGVYAPSQAPSISNTGYANVVPNRRQSSNSSMGYGNSGYAFAPPAVSSYAQMQPQQYFPQHPRSNSNARKSDPVPDFPATLASMESSVSEAPSSQPQVTDVKQPMIKIERPNSELRQSSESPQRPENTSSDAGTYTCTYHGCKLRFESPAKLQKHKREGHRQTSPKDTSPSAGMTSSSLGLRNSQAGPHKCERINPSTGKPCNTIFSRPYDLTRHEDTIHNARKEKVRCHLCTEEKTFSRNDALTRHMRVVHPEVDWPGKITRRKNARD